MSPIATNIDEIYGGIQTDIKSMRDRLRNMQPCPPGEQVLPGLATFENKVVNLKNELDNKIIKNN